MPGPLNLIQNFNRPFRETTKFFRAVACQLGKNDLTALTMVIGGALFRLGAVVGSSTGGAVANGVTLPAQSLTITGQAIRLRIKGRTAANANTKVINLLFGSTTVVLLNAASNAKDFSYDVTIYRTGLNAQQIVVNGYANGALIDNLSTTSAQVETGSINLQVQLATATANNDALLQELTIEAQSG